MNTTTKISKLADDHYRVTAGGRRFDIEQYDADGHWHVYEVGDMQPTGEPHLDIDEAMYFIRELTDGTETATEDTTMNSPLQETGQYTVIAAAIPNPTPVATYDSLDDAKRHTAAHGGHVLVHLACGTTLLV